MINFFCVPPLVSLRRAGRRTLTTLLLVVASMGGSAASTWAAQPLRLAIVAPDRSPTDGMDTLSAALTQTFGFEISSALRSLSTADAVIVHRGPGALSATDTAEWRTFLRSGKPLVLIAATPDAWPTEPAFATDVLGAKPGKLFAEGAPLTVINLFPHPILSGIRRFETKQTFPLYSQLGDDAQMIMEGTAGEATAPLAWVRRRAEGRMAHFVLSHPSLFSDPAYQQMIGQAVLWAVQRPIPGAETAVQRTFMPESYPGAFAITLPNGPSLCFDPVRGGVNYIWDGDFIDLRPRWITKQGEPARFFGEIFYHEKEWQPFRAAAPNAASELRFRGYTLRAGIPEFHYEIGERDVFETFSAGSTPGSLLRTFRVGPGKAPLWLNIEPQTKSEVIVRGLERDGPLASFSSPAGGEFTIEIRRKASLTP
jgi:type 1 glutamine amidotransferase